VFESCNGDSQSDNSDKTLNFTKQVTKMLQQLKQIIIKKEKN